MKATDLVAWGNHVSNNHVKVQKLLSTKDGVELSKMTDAEVKEFFSVLAKKEREALYKNFQQARLQATVAASAVVAPKESIKAMTKNNGRLSLEQLGAQLKEYFANNATKVSYLLQ